MAKKKSSSPGPHGMMKESLAEVIKPKKKKNKYSKWGKQFRDYANKKEIPKE